MNRRIADEQDRPVDIFLHKSTLSIPPPLSSSLPSNETTEGKEGENEFESFLGWERDDDTDENFYPPPELEEWYEGKRD